MRKTLLTIATVLVLGALPALPQGSTTDDNEDRPTHVVFRALLSPSHETPPVSGVNISGEGVIEMTLAYTPPGSLSQAIVDFRVNYNAETPQTFTAMHIHRGAAGVAGPVVVDSIFGAQVEASGSGSLFRQNVVTDLPTLTVIEAILANPSNYYLNVHSTTNPAGIIRGQLMPDPATASERQFRTIGTQLDRMELMLRNIGRALGLVFPPAVTPTPSGQ
ncbi:MAG: CHRD domain-containing protein [Bryobacteraceae bacterium]|nr:CHRD domain-containing protein [Bryobacteraceae bacterium]